MPHGTFRHLVLGLLVLVALLLVVVELALLGGGPPRRLLREPVVPGFSGAR
ncbi:MAG TPA: hypothetical protein VF406_19115 [Thermodesulfobacteriota bacterium]